MDRAAAPWRIGGPAAASLAINALLIAALLHLGSGRSRERVEQAAITVLSLAVTKGAEDGKEETEAATPAAPAPAQPPPPAPSRDIAPAPVPAMLPPPVVAMRSPLLHPTPMAAPPAISPSPSASAAAAAAQPATAPAAPSAPVRRGTADGLDVKAPSGTSRSYAAKVRSWLYAHKIYPRAAKMRHIEGRVQVRFVLDRAGMLIEGVVLNGSGHAVLDDEAAAMMRRASPYPRAPAELTGERIEFTAPIEFTLPV